MALSLDSIYKPVNDFFLNLFKTDAESPVFFKFDKFGSVLSNEDFIDPRTPEHLYSASLAGEKFSGIVNTIPIEDSDGLNVFFTQNTIDSNYHDILLGPSVPFFPEGANDLTKESIISSFSQIKADAIKSWENIQLESSTGLMFKYKPSLATPENWYDIADNSIWTSHLFQASETITPIDNTPKFQLWRLKLDDAAFQKVLPGEENETFDLGNSNEHHVRVQMVKAKKLIVPSENLSQTANFSTHAVRTDAVQGLASAHTKSFINDTAVLVQSTNSPNAASFDLHKKFLTDLPGMDIKQRLVISQKIKENAPTQPMTTSSISISFDYCLVKINRPWYHNSFINNKAWFIPNIAKGQLSINDNSGVNISVLPIGFLAIKNLNITANWSSEDLIHSKNATDLGPFEVSFDSVNNKLSHQGIQIIGWMLQKMPDLPPNNAS